MNRSRRKNWRLYPWPDLLRLAKDGVQPSSASLKEALEEQGSPWQGRRAAMRRMEVVARALELDIWAAIYPDPEPRV